MKKRTARRTHPVNLSQRGIGALPWSYFVLIAICGCIIAAGFLLAARQHFVSMDLGMKNSKLRKQLEDLEAENRRLMLARETAFSPIEMTRSAKRLGFVETPAVGQALTVVSSPSVKTPAPVAVVPVPIIKRKVENDVSITKTSFQRPAARTEPPPPTSLQRERVVKVSEKPAKNGEKSERSGAAAAKTLR
ncbi:MAG TPA: hypothetical protein PKD26_05325 [Pyrinomonadaceae bacterium]|nr:hypothetical protein [Pyrinomonadaceae bacterium]